LQCYFSILDGTCIDVAKKGHGKKEKKNLYEIWSFYLFIFEIGHLMSGAKGNKPGGLSGWRTASGVRWLRGEIPSACCAHTRFKLSKGGKSRLTAQESGGLGLKTKRSEKKIECHPVTTHLLYKYK